jgi:hypothetical protein
MVEKVKSVYAIPCLFTERGLYDPDDVFFVTFSTKDENEALKLASCICGKRKADRSLVIINANGQVFPY